MSCACPCPKPSCCSGKDADKEKQEPLPVLDARGCTDIFFCLLLLLWVLGWIILSCVAATTGDPNALIYGLDHYGNRCGVDNAGKNPPGPDFTDKQKVHYPRMDKDITDQLVADPTIMKTPWKIKLYGLCVKDCPTTFNVSNPKLIADYNEVGTEDVTPEANDGKPWLSPLPTKSMLNRCIPTLAESEDSKVFCGYPTCTALGLACEGMFDNPPPQSWNITANCPCPVNNDCTIEQRLENDRDGGCLARGITCDVKLTEVTGMAYTSTQNSRITEMLGAATAEFSAFMRALSRGKWVIFGIGGCLSLVLGFMWIIFLQHFAGFMVYFAIFAVCLLCILVTIFCYFLGGLVPSDIADDLSNATTKYASDYVDASDLETENTTVWKIAAYIMTAFTAGILILFISMRKNIALLIVIVGESAETIKNIKAMVVWPFVTVVLDLGLVIWFALVAAFIATISEDTSEWAHGDVLNGTMGPAASADIPDPSEMRKSMFVFHLFSFLWTVNFVESMGYLTITAVVSYWFFYYNLNPESEDYNKAGALTHKFPVLASAKRMTRYHMGSAAFGSLIMALVQLARFALEYLRENTKALQEGNYVAKLAFKVVACCLCCLDKCVQFVSHYAFIYVALVGQSFCGACKATFFLFAKHPGQVVLNAAVVTVLACIQTIAIPMIVACVSYEILKNQMVLQNPLYPTFFAVFASFVVTRCFATVFETTINTLFVCLYRDKEHFNGRYTGGQHKKVANALGMPTSDAESGSGGEAEPLVPAESSDTSATEGAAE